MSVFLSLSILGVTQWDLHLLFACTLLYLKMPVDVKQVLYFHVKLLLWVSMLTLAGNMGPDNGAKRKMSASINLLECIFSGKWRSELHLTAKGYNFRNSGISLRRHHKNVQVSMYWPAISYQSVKLVLRTHFSWAYQKWFFWYFSLVFRIYYSSQCCQLL